MHLSILPNHILFNKIYLLDQDLVIDLYKQKHKILDEPILLTIDDVDFRERSAGPAIFICFNNVNLVEYLRYGSRKKR